MKLAVLILVIFSFGTVSSQTNSDVVKIVEQAVSYESAEDIRNFFSYCGFRLVEEEVAHSLGAERWETVYIDAQNRIYCWSKANLHDAFHSIRVKLTFDSWRSAQSNFTACGYTALWYEEEKEYFKDDPYVFILRRKIYDTPNPLANYITITGNHTTVYLNGTQCMVYCRFSGPQIEIEE